VKLPQHIHNASEGFSDRRTFTAERVELALERAVRPAKLAQFTAKSLELLFSRFERAAQAIKSGAAKQKMEEFIAFSQKLKAKA